MYLALSRLSSFLVCGHHLTSLTRYVFQNIDHWTDTFMICISTYQFLKCVLTLGLAATDPKGGSQMVSNIVKGINRPTDWGLVKAELHV